jgi:hypothetical protein
MKLRAAIENAVEHNRGVLVCDADAAQLQILLKKLSAPRGVVLLDYREHISENLVKELQAALRDDQILHIAIGPRLDIRLREALMTIHNQRSNLKLSGVIILSTSATNPDDLYFDDPNQRLDLFPVVVCSGDHIAKWIPKSFHQAVVLIHGIGEQRPGRTLRPFADAVLPKISEWEGKKYHSEIDEVSFDYRKLVANTKDKPQSNLGLCASIVTPRNTDFFEYYWAPITEGTTWRHVIRWLWRILKRLPSKHLLAVWAISWLLLITGFIAGVSGTGEWSAGLFHTKPFVLAFASWIGLWVFETVVLDYLGDAARYLDDHPANDSIRTEIRRTGVDLLGSLIRSKKYDRIVVVGHSLGSVIAYDILKHLWETEFWNAYGESVMDFPQTALNEYELAAKALEPKSSDDQIVQYQEKQIQLLKELRAFGNPWPVTDLITLGSPLAHSRDLIPDFTSRLSDGELPENPPKKFKPTIGSATLEECYALSAGPDLIPETIHLGIPLRNGFFAITRWTNLYIPARFGLFGDFVGGALRPLFGNGIRDREVASGSFLKDLTLLAHISYWHIASSSKRSLRKSLALDALIDALDLNGERLAIPRFETSAVYRPTEASIAATLEYSSSP